ncbi:MAG: alpha/beta fold hydrolase [Chloroflexi bacterium]|nr:alpha/beta fold hydrolase [Chloroflexota bacterium]
MSERRHIPRPDGGAIELVLDGDPEGTVLIFHHGTPGSGVPSPGMAGAATQRGLRYVALARPGYAGSTRRPGRRVVDVARDVEMVLDAFGRERCLTLGTSGGGPHALACAATLPDRVAAAATIGCVAPFSAQGLDFLNGMAQENIDEFGAAVEGPAALRAFLDRAAPGFRFVTEEDVAEALGGLVPAVDRAAIARGYAASLAEDIRTGLEPGDLGWFDDDLAFVDDWGFDPAGISVPVSLWQGEQDRMVPFAHGAWLARRLPRVRAHLLPDHGHLSITVDSIGAVLDDLIEAADARG